jgi:hypothetical protein
MEESRRNVRRKPNDYFLVFNRYKDEFIGRVMNMSIDGIMMYSEEPMEINKLYYCRMALPEKINGLEQIFFDAESMWSKENKNVNMFETGYKIRHIPPQHLEVVKVLMKKWMASQSEALNIWSQ